MDEPKKNVRMSSENTVGSVVLYNVHDRYPRMVVGDPENGMQKDCDDNKESVVDGGGLGVTIYIVSVVYDSSPAAGESISSSSSSSRIGSSISSSSMSWSASSSSSKITWK